MIRMIWNVVICILLNIFGVIDTKFTNYRYDLIRKNGSKDLLGKYWYAKQSKITRYRSLEEYYSLSFVIKNCFISEMYLYN